MTASSPAPEPKYAPLPYTEITDDTYAVDAAKSFTVTEQGRGTLVLRGPCPRCRALIDIPVVSSTFDPRALLAAGCEPGHLRPQKPVMMNP